MLGKSAVVVCNYLIAVFDCVVSFWQGFTHQVKFYFTDWGEREVAEAVEATEVVSDFVPEARTHKKS